MKSILIISFSSIQHDARVSRQIEFLKSSNKLTVAAFDFTPNSEINYIQISRPNLSIQNKLILAFFLFFRFHNIAYKMLYGHPSLKKKIGQESFDLIIANDIESLPLAFQLGLTERVILDAHEYAPRQFEDKLSWRIFFQPLNISICKKFIGKVSAMTTIGKGIAEEYKKNFECDPVVINNATWHNEINPAFNTSNKIRLIHHGVATVSRHLENMIEMMRFLDDRFTLDLMLVIPEMASSKTRNYISYLRNLAHRDSRINFLPAVKSDEVIPVINQYDVGIIIVPSVNFNYANGLPNKLFEFIQAKLAICVGPIPEIAEIVKSYDIGIANDNFDPKEVASKLSKITNDHLIRFKTNCVKASAELSAEKNSILFNELVKKTFANKN